MSEQGWDAATVARRRIHERYILFILLSILVGVITVKWSDVPKLTEYLGFALTLASLLLAVLAIAYAMYSNRDLETNLASLVLSINYVKDIASTLSSSSAALTNDIRTLSERTGGIDTQLKTYQSEIAATLAKTQERKTEVQGNSPPPETQPIAKFNLEELIDRTAIAGKYVLLSLVISLLNKKPLDLSALMKQMGVQESYANGFASALINLNVYSGTAQMKKLEVDAMPNFDERSLTKILEATLEMAREKNKKRKESKVRLMTDVVAKDLGRMRTFLEEHNFQDFGFLDSIERVSLIENKPADEIPF